MKLTYTQQGDYFIPDITIRQPRKALGHYGRLRKAYLQEFRPILFNELVLSEKLFEHCLEIEEAARHHPAGACEEVRHYRGIESGKSNALGRQDEYVQGTDRGNREAGTDL